MDRLTIPSLVACVALAILPAAVMADHREADDRPPTPFGEFAERAYAWVAHWVEDPTTEIAQGHGSLGGVSLADELRYVVPDGCYLSSYGAYWGLASTLLALGQAPDRAALDVERGRFREELSRTVRLVEADRLRCAEAALEQEPGPVETASPPGAASPPAGASLIELHADATLRFIGEDGEPVSAISVVPGETLRIRVDNTAGFEHSFFIGTEEELSGPRATTDVGIDPWTSGTRELTWNVPEDSGGLMFGCTVPGHFPLMHGDVVIAGASS